MWSRSSQLWFPQFSNLPHTKSHSCQPSGSSRVSRAFFLPLPFAKPASDAKGQQARLHWCRPHARSALQGRSHRISVSDPASPRARARAAAWSAEQSTSRVMEPHLQGRTSRIAQGGHGPVWHGAEQTCAHPSRGFMHVESQVGTGSVHAVRMRRVPGGKNDADFALSACLPHGQ